MQLGKGMESRGDRWWLLVCRRKGGRVRRLRCGLSSFKGNLSSKVSKEKVLFTSLNYEPSLRFHLELKNRVFCLSEFTKPYIWMVFLSGFMFTLNEYLKIIVNHKRIKKWKNKFCWTP